MTKNTPLLSICIPTYNRAELLAKTLESIVEDETFLNTDLVEVVVSDNCSTDSTRELVEEYVKRFPQKIFYNKTKENVGGDRNFRFALTLAKGKLLKLNNDKCPFTKGAVSKIVNAIKENLDEEHVLFFPNRISKKSEKEIVCADLNEFVSCVNFMSTWIVAFSIWKNDFVKISDFERYIKLLLVQTDVLFRIIASGKKVKVFNEDLLDMLKTPDNGGYNPAWVFGKNYLFILNEYVQANDLSLETYLKAKKNVLFDLIGPLCFDYKKRYSFHTEGTFGYLFPIYKFDLYFYFWILENVTKKILFALLLPFKNIYNIIWLNLNVWFYKYVFRNEKRLEKFQKRLEERIK